MSLFVRLERLEATVAKLEKENKALRKENAELKQERSVFDFIRETIYAHFNSQPASLLMPVDSS